jgi:hypothetical protein
VYLCVLSGSENKVRLFPYTALTDGFYNRDGVCLLRDMDRIYVYNRYNTVKAQCSLYVLPGLTLKNSALCSHSVFMCFVWILKKQLFFPDTALTDWFL